MKCDECKNFEVKEFCSDPSRAFDKPYRCKNFKPKEEWKDVTEEITVRRCARDTLWIILYHNEERIGVVDSKGIADMDSNYKYTIEPDSYNWRIFKKVVWGD